jgi:hypothetical protein
LDDPSRVRIQMTSVCVLKHLFCVVKYLLVPYASNLGRYTAERGPYASTMVDVAGDNARLGNLLKSLKKNSVPSASVKAWELEHPAGSLNSHFSHGRLNLWRTAGIRVKTE